MTLERWQEIAALYEAARDRPVTARAAFLAEAGADDDVRREVEALLARTVALEDDVEEASGPGSDAATDAGAAGLAGQRLGAYELVARIGAGGMGDVYRACDTRLGRDVAVKVLRPDFAADPDRLSRFQREARVLAALNHPNIATIHGIEDRDSVRALVMELVEGATLAERLARGPLPLQEALEVARQIARALDASHEKGIVHRDLKPANIKIAANGIVKVLDFGLAKALAVETSGAAYDSVDATGGGRILGTPIYMSPEQTRGQAIDKRTDIWAFGCVLYEMLTGLPPFAGKTIFEVTAGILEREPDWSALPAGIPASIHRVLRRCLEKDPGRRLRDIGEAHFEIDQVLAGLAKEMLAGGDDRGRIAATPLVEVPVARRRWWRHPAVVIGAPVVALGLLLPWVPLPGSAGRTLDSVAVLPFTNATDDPEAEYLSDGLTEDLINSLSRVPALRVVPRSIVFRYKDQFIDPRAVGEQLNVRAVVMGRVERRGQATFVVTELIDTETVAQLWGEQYRQGPADIIALQDSMVKEIVDRLRPDGLPSEEQGRITRHYTRDSEAYRLYLRGRFHWRKGTAEGHKQAMVYFQQAIAQDPTFALGYSGLSDAYAGLGFLGAVRPVEAFPKAKAAALRALESDDLLGEAHSSLAVVKVLYDWDYSGAELEFERALELEPDFAPTYLRFAAVLIAQGRMDEAIAAGARAEQLDPLSATIAANVGHTYYLGGRHDDAIEQSRRSLDLDPNLTQAKMLLVHALIAKGLANPELEEAFRSHGLDSDPSMMAIARTLAGDRAQAERVLAEWTTGDPVLQLYQVAQIYARFGDRDRAFEWLERAYRERQPQLLGIHFDPLFQRLRDDPRFVDLVARVGLSSRSD